MRISIDYNRHVYKRDAVYITAGLQTGIAFRYYRIGENTKENNLAFSHFFINYMKRICDKKVECQIGKTVSSVSIKSSTETMFTDLRELLNTLNNLELDQQTFIEIKNETVENFERVYKDGSFRSRYKALEIADIVKGFSFGLLVNNLDSLNYESFCELYQDLIRKGKCAVYVNGNIRDLELDELEELKSISEDASDFPIVCGKQIDPYLLDDAHIIETAREACNTSVLHFSFPESISILDRYLWMALESERIPYRDRETTVDAYDASIIVSMPDVTALKESFSGSLKNDQFQNARNTVLAKYSKWLKKSPCLFNASYVEMKMNGCSLVEFLQTVDGLDYESYLNAVHHIRPLICEGQIVMRREVFNG